MGYLQAVPKEWTNSRWDGWVSHHGYPPNLPDCGPAFYLIDALSEIGYCLNNGMGRSPIDFKEVKAFIDTTEMIKEPWEARLIVQLSREYLIGMSIGEKVSGKAPWVDPDFKLVGINYVPQENK